MCSQQPLARLWRSLKGGLLNPGTSAAEAAKLHMAFYGGAFAVIATLLEAISRGELAVLDALDAIDAEIHRQATLEIGRQRGVRGKAHCP